MEMKNGTYGRKMRDAYLSRLRWNRDKGSTLIARDSCDHYCLKKIRFSKFHVEIIHKFLMRYWIKVFI